MKKWVLSFVLLIAFIIILSGTNCMAESVENAEEQVYENFTYIVTENNEVRITGYIGTDSNVEMPDIIDGKKVTEIGYRALYGKSEIVYLKLSNYLESINQSAFAGTGIKKIVIPASLKNYYGSSLGGRIIYGAFEGCNNLKEVIFEEGATIIPKYFFYNKNVKKVYIPKSVTLIESYLPTFYVYKDSPAENLLKLQNISYFLWDGTFPENEIITGTLESIDTLGFKVTIDGVVYDVEGDYMDIPVDIMMNYNDKRVICTLSDDKIKRIDALTDIIVPNINISILGGDLLYQNNQFSETKKDILISIGCKIKEPYQLSDFSNTENLSIICNQFILELPENNIKINGKSKIIETEIEKLNPGEVKTLKYEADINNSYVPSAVNENVWINANLTYSDKEVSTVKSLHISNIDLQKKQAEVAKASKSRTKNLKVVQEELKELTTKNSAFALDTNLYNYFSDQQINIAETYLNIWIGQIIEAITIHFDENEKKIRESMWNRLGINTKSILIGNRIKAVTKINAKTKYGEKTFKFTLVMHGYVLGEGEPYAAEGYLTYEVEDKKEIPKSIATSGNSTVVFANMKTFVEKLKALSEDCIKEAYKEVWGNHIDQISDLLIDGLAAKVIKEQYGSLSNGIYTIFTEPAKASAKKISVLCPVDVYIYDIEGNLCGSVINNIVNTFSDTVAMYTENDEKYIYLVGDDYKIECIGNDSGIMTYTIAEYDDCMNEIRKTEFFNIPLETDKKYTGIILEPAFIAGQLYALSTDTGELIYANEDNLEEAPEKIYVDGIAISDTKKELYSGESFHLTAKIIPDNASDTTVTFSSDNETIANVDNSGIVYAKNPGVAYITVMSFDGEWKAVCQVIVKEIESDKNINTSDNSDVISISDKTFIQPFTKSNQKVTNGTVFSNKSAIYLIKKDNTLKFIRPVNKKIKSLVIPDTVKVNGKIYKVTEIAEKSCKNIKTLQKITIGKNIVSIGKESFYGCKSIKSVKIKSVKLKKVGKKAFCKLNKKSKISVPGSKKKQYKKILKKVIDKSIII